MRRLSTFFRPKLWKKYADIKKICQKASKKCAPIRRTLRRIFLMSAYFFDAGILFWCRGTYMPVSFPQIVGEFFFPENVGVFRVKNTSTLDTPTRNDKKRETAPRVNDHFYNTLYTYLSVRVFRFFRFWRRFWARFRGRFSNRFWSRFRPCDYLGYILTCGVH